MHLNANQHVVRNCLQEAKKIIRTEAIAVEDLSQQLDQSFVEVVKAIHESEGKVVVTGVGKSGHVGEKMAATLSSTARKACTATSAWWEKGHRDSDIQQRINQRSARTIAIIKCYRLKENRHHLQIRFHRGEKL